MCPRMSVTNSTRPNFVGGCNVTTVSVAGRMLRFADGTSRGRAVFAAKEIEAGALLLTEAPLLSMALPESRSAVSACERCSRPLGTVWSQLEHLTGLKRLPKLPIDEEEAYIADDVPCRRGCRAVRYCSASCEEQHAQAHLHLCAGRGPAAAAALARFETHAHATHECFLFGARIVADVLAHQSGKAATAEGRYAELCRIPWWDLSDEGEAKSARGRKQAREDASTSLRLLRTLLAADAAEAPSSPAPRLEWLTLEAWGGLLGAARRNAICVQLPHPLLEFVPALLDWESTSADAAEARALQPLLQALPSPLPETLWTAVYPRISCVNHSCSPNAEVHFLSENHEGTLMATRRIDRGEELFISYIDDNERSNFTKRRDSLRDYGFECACTKCEVEESWVRRLRPRPMAPASP